MLEINTITDPLKQLEARLRDGTLGRAVEAQRYGTALDETAQVLADQTAKFARLEALQAAAPLLVGQVEAADRQHLLEWSAHIEGAGERIAAADSQEELKAIRRDMREAANQVDRMADTLRRAWKARVEEEFRPFYALDEVLVKCHIDAALRQRIRGVAADGLALAGRFPPTLEDRTHFEDLLAKRDSLRAELAGAGAGEMVVKFLLAVVDQEATLADVPADVWQWLAQRGALALFSVRLG